MLSFSSTSVTVKNKSKKRIGRPESSVREAYVQYISIDDFLITTACPNKHCAWKNHWLSQKSARLADQILNDFEAYCLVCNW